MAEQEDPKTLKKILQICELFHGRFTQKEVQQLLQKHDGDDKATSNFLLTSEPDKIREAIHGISRPTKTKDYIAAVQSDQDIVNDVTQNLVTSRVRQFACGPCDNAWWRKVPSRKQVSKCKKCQKKYDPVPRSEEWGWAIFECACGNSFSGYGQINKTQSDCRKCGNYVFPSEIRPPWKRRARRSRQRHSCDAPDCGGHGHYADDIGVAQGVNNLEINPTPPDYQYGNNGGKQETEVLYQRKYSARENERADDSEKFGGRRPNRPEHNHDLPGSYKTGNVQKTCVSPVSRSGKKKVICASQQHISSGSTVTTWMSQDDLGSLTSYVPSLASVRE